MTVRVAVDAMGGDRAPEEIVAGAAEAVSAGLTPVLYGPAGLEAHGLGRLLVHPDHAVRRDERQAVRVDPRLAVEGDVDPVRSSVEGAGDDLVRGAVAPHRVDRDSGQGYGAGVRRGSISRPLYV